MKAVCIDSDADHTATMVADWRSTHVCQALQANGMTTQQLRGNMATRIYLERELKDVAVTYLSGSGHGLYDEFQGNDNLSVLEIGEYQQSEVRGKIIHLLSCNTAFELGIDLIQNGCLAFFGYDSPFSFYPDFLDEFMSPNKILDEMISQGRTAEAVHDAVLLEYQRVIDALQRKGASITIVGDMMTNLNHFCSPSIDRKWGNPQAKINRPIPA